MMLLASKAQHDNASTTEKNRLGNSDFTQDYINNAGTFSTSDVQNGWVHPGSPRWNWNSTNENTDTDDIGSQSMMQGVNDSGVTTGTGHTLEFEVVSSTGGSDFRVYVWGINGTAWSIMHWSMTAEPTGATSYTTLLNTGNIDAVRTNQTLSYNINLGTGYDYIVVCFRISGNTGETLILDNIQLLTI